MRHPSDLCSPLHRDLGGLDTICLLCHRTDNEKCILRPRCPACRGFRDDGEHRQAGEMMGLPVWVCPNLERGEWLVA